MISLATCILGFLVTACMGTARNDIFVGYSEKASTNLDKGNFVILETKKGQIYISLMVGNAPHTTNAVSRLAASTSGCPKCRFYRNEARPEEGSLGPPYGLLQGSLASLEITPPREGNLIARRGHACMIPGTKEFFISLMDHSEWGTAHTCWGEVDDMTAVDALVNAPYHNFTHPEYGTVMRMLETESPFEVKSRAITTS